MSARGCRLERPPFGPAASPTTLRAGSSACGPGLFQRGVPPQASPPRPVAAEGGICSCPILHTRWRRCLGLANLPMPLAIKGAMHIHRGVKVGMGFVVTHRTPEQLAPFLGDALAASIGEPLPLGAAARTILRCSMWIDFDGDDALCIGFLSGVLIDFAAHLVRTPAVHASRLAGLPSFDRAEALKKRDTGGIPGTDRGDDARHLVGGIFIQPIDMPPELLVTVLTFDWLARLPLLFGNAFEMVVSMCVQAMIGHKYRLDDRAMRSRRDYRQILDIEIDRDRDQVRILLALHHLPGCDLLHLRDMQRCRVGSQDERRALSLPIRFLESLYEVVTGVDRVLHPAPFLSRVDIDAHKGLLEIKRLQIK